MTDERQPAPRGLAALMAGLIDYAGLFPPAGLGMADAVERYRRYREWPQAWALGRFVVPVSRLEELDRAVAALEVTPGPGTPWDITALVSPPHAEDLARVTAFNEAHGAGAGWRAAIRAVELMATSAEELAQAARCVPPGLEAYFEVPGGAGIDALCQAAAVSGQGLKLRTGGTAVNAFPPSTVVARVMAACAAARVPFKATAGLHHAVRASHPVTYDREAPRATMHGFLNVFVSACLLFAGRADVAAATRVLEDELPASFRFGDDGVRYRDLLLTVDEVRSARRFARSFGSCSFEEPLSAVNL